MAEFPDDIFTEPSDVDPNTLANLGPLRRLAGIWEGDRGVDLNPKADGPERRVYRERIEMQPIDPQANGPQLFYGMRYHVSGHRFLLSFRPACQPATLAPEVLPGVKVTGIEIQPLITPMEGYRSAPLSATR